MSRLLIFLTFVLTTFPSMATCWEQAGTRYGIEPELLQAIAIVESGLNPGAININKDGTRDYGLMQINSSHLPALRKFRINQKALLNVPCQNVMTGAWILAGNIRQFGYGWEAVGAYNAGTARNAKRRALRQKYIQKVVPHYQRLKKNKQSRRSL